MSRQVRKRYGPEPGDVAGFDEEIYAALRQSPWWMISISAHVALFVASSMFQSQGEATSPASEMRVAQLPDATPADPAEEPPEIADVTPVDVEVPRTVVEDAKPADHDEDPTDMPFEDVGGGFDGISDSPWNGPSNNSLIGIGGSLGGGKLGLGGMYSLRRPRGAKQKIDVAVDDALRWLKAHQSPDGGWECETFRKWCDLKPASGAGPEGAGKAAYDVGVTGMALLAFLGAGYTQRSDDANGFGKVVAAGLRYLKNVQDAEGCFGNRSSGHYVYNHAIAALAMVEAYGMTGSSVYKNPTQKALDFIVVARNPYFAWRYGVKPGDNDTSVSGWMMMALKSAKLINAADVKNGKAPSLTLDEDCFEGIKAWIDKMTDPDFGRVGYQARGTGPARPTELVDRFPAEKSESMTGVGMLARIFLGENPKTSDPIKKGAELCAKLAPSWNPNDGSIDMYYWYYATLAMFQVGGEPWNKWNKAMQGAIVDTQRKDTDYCMYKGSWDPLDPWGPDGGRVYSTSCMALCLEVYYRYDKVFGTKEDSTGGGTEHK